jgi:hypothetical protein
LIGRGSLTTTAYMKAGKMRVRERERKGGRERERERDCK